MEIIDRIDELKHEYNCLESKLAIVREKICEMSYRHYNELHRLLHVEQKLLEEKEKLMKGMNENKEL